MTDPAQASPEQRAHKCFTASGTSYLRNLDREDLQGPCIAVHYQKPPTRDEADMIAESRTITGTLRAERTIKAKHYALEAEQSLTAFRQYQEGRKNGPEPGSADWLKQSPNFHPGDLA